MTENEKFIFESIYNHIRTGFYSIAEIQENILEEIEDNELEEEISEEWAFETIEKEHKKLIAESKKWEKPTDTDKLIEVFDDLCKENIIALHNAGYDNSDAEYEVLQVEQKLNQNQTSSDGYCFYHEEDLLHAIRPINPSLQITFQKIENSDDNIAINIGKKVVKKLTEKGFNIEWNEEANRKILIKNFHWQFLFEDKRDLHDYDEVIELMLGEKEYDFCLKTLEIYNINPSLTDIMKVIENLEYSDEDNPSFIILDFRKTSSEIQYLQAIINEDSSYYIELRTDNKDDFHHYRLKTKEKNVIKDYFNQLYKEEMVDYSKWNNITEQFL